jgi:hypothetical protein
MHITMWVDDGAGDGTKCNNVRDGREEVIVNDATLSQFIANGSGILPIASTDNGTMMNKPLPAGDYCIGVAWSVPGPTGNEVQTDKLGADLAFRIEQSRNNAKFSCYPVLK